MKKMNYFTQIGCCLLMLIASGNGAQEYTINPMYARTFGLLNLFSIPLKVTRSEFSELTNRVLTLERNYLTLRSDVNGLRTDLTRLQSQVNAIPRARCPLIVAVGARMLPGYPFCYTVVSAPVSNSAARSACALQGGTLAEPLFSQSAAFYTALRTAFPTQIAAIGASARIWIGLVREANESDFHYLSNNIIIYNPREVFAGLISEEAIPDYATFVTPGTSQWNFEPVPNNGTSTSTHAYICQFNIIY